MKTKLKQSVVFILLLSVFCACNQSPKNTQKQFVLNGTLEGITEGKIILASETSEGTKMDTTLIKDGKFEFKGNFPQPTQAFIIIADTEIFNIIYVENAEMTLNGNVNDFENANITGSKTQDDFTNYNAQNSAITEKYKDVKTEFYKPGLSDKRKSELEKELEKQGLEYEALNARFIKENPTSHYSAVLVSGQVSGMPAAEAEKILNKLDPQLQKVQLIVNLRAKVAKMKEVEVGMDKMMANASNVSYKVDEKFKGGDLKNVIYLGVFSNNNICALQKDGTVQILDPNGKALSSFKPELKGKPSSIAVDKSNRIYIMCGLQKKVSQKVRGKSYDRMLPMGVECTVFTSKGEQTNKFKLVGLLTATGARVVDNNLIVSDFQKKRIAMFDSKTGKAGASIEDMRPCCGILDFSVNAKKEILVANLGAFRVQGFDFTGKSIVAFGQRGKSLNDFHGCCNPVSVANLSNGAIVTVEKDPTRIKIYSKEGANQIAGIEELVKGCSYIPMIVDAKDNLYLASGEKGMVKCVSVN